MYLYERDGPSGDVVGMLVAKSALNPDADHAAVIASVKEQWAAGFVDHAPALILIIDDDYPVPDATWRRRYAELRDHSPYERYRVAIVTRSSLIRGAHTAINWVRPPSRKFQTESFATFDAAAAWVGAGATSPGLSRLHQALLKRDGRAR
jgi:hypothetical protein